jgi:hypothetical protein
LRRSRPPMSDRAATLPLLQEHPGAIACDCDPLRRQACAPSAHRPSSRGSFEARRHSVAGRYRS